MGKYGESSQYCYLGLELYEKLNDRMGMAHMISGIAENSLYLGNYQDALEKLSSSTKIFIEYDDWINVGANYNLMGRVCRLMKNYTEANMNHERALEFGKQANNLQMIATAHVGMADVLMAQENFSKAIDNFLIAEVYYTQWSNYADLAATYRKLAKAYRSIGEYEEAKENINKAFEHAQLINNKRLIADVYHETELLDSTFGNWKGAYDNHQLYIIYRDSVFNQETTEQIVLLQNQYEFDKKQATARAEQERRNMQNRIQLIFLIIIIILILVLVYVQYRNQKSLARINLDLKNKSESLEREMEEKSAILHVVSHDLKSPLNKITGLINLMEMTFVEINEEQREFVTYIRTSIEQGNHLIKNLLDAERMTSKAIQKNEEVVNIPDFLRAYQIGINAQLHGKQQRLELDCALTDSEFKIDQQLVTQVLDNLISNASKFSEKGKSVFLRVWQEQNRLKLSIRDEGPGISSEDQKKMFRKFQMLAAKSTNGEPSAGLGLSIVKSIVESMNGTITVTSELGKGTEFVLGISYN